MEEARRTGKEWNFGKTAPPAFVSFVCVCSFSFCILYYFRFRSFRSSYVPCECVRAEARALERKESQLRFRIIGDVKKGENAFGCSRAIFVILLLLFDVS